MIAAVICIGIAVFSGITGKDSIVTRAADTLLRPAQKAITYTAIHVADAYNKYFRYDELVAEKEALEKKVSDLEDELESAQTAIRENEELRSMLGVTERNTEFTYTPSEVIGRTLDEWSSIITIDAGKAEGIEKNDCVVTPQGMVGFVSSLSEHSAQVTTIIDSDMAAGARLVRTGEIAVAEGDYNLMTNGKLKLAYLSRSADVVVGDTVQTSGAGDLFPRGLGIGTVESMQTESDGMTNYAVIEPLVDVTSLTRVYVITDVKVSE